MTAVLTLDPHLAVRFLGDLHLGDGTRTDAFGDKDDLLVAFLRECQTACDAVVFMGDVFDLPQALTSERIVAAHPRVIDAIEDLSQRLRIYFLLGNHDWRVDYASLFPAAGVGERLKLGNILAWHGHQLDPACRGQGLDFAAMAAHSLVERLFGFRLSFHSSEHRSWQDRAARRLLNGYLRGLSREATLYRLLGSSRRADAREALVHRWSRSLEGDPHGLFERATRWARTEAYEALVCGHAHLPGVVELGHSYYVNCGSWTSASTHFAAWDRKRVAVSAYPSGEPIGSENYGWMLGADKSGDLAVVGEPRAPHVAFPLPTQQLM